MDAALQAGHLVFQLHDALDAFERNALLGEPLDFAEHLDVMLGVAPGPARRAAGADDAQPVVLPECLWMHVRQFSGNGDHKDRRVDIYAHCSSSTAYCC